jgi:hypothetical protein
MRCIARRGDVSRAFEGEHEQIARVFGSGVIAVTRDEVAECGDQAKTRDTRAMRSSSRARECRARRDHEIEERPHLRGGQVSRRIERVERKHLVLPAWKHRDQRAFREQVACSELLELREALACNARGDRARDIVEHEPSMHVDVDPALALTELPFEGAVRLWIREQDALVVRNVLRALRCAAASEVCGRGARQDPSLEQLLGDQVGGWWWAEPHGRIEAFRDEVAHARTRDDLELQRRVLSEEDRKPRREHEPREEQVDVHAKSAADLCRRGSSAIHRVVQLAE